MILLSGGWQPVTNKSTAEATFQQFMKYNNVDSFHDLLRVSEDTIRSANIKAIDSQLPGSFEFNPIAWGKYAPKCPSKLFGEGKFAKNVDVMLSHAEVEGADNFRTAFKAHNTTLDELITMALPDASVDDRKWTHDTYGSEDIPDAVSIQQVIGDVIFRCHVKYATDAYDGNVYRHKWNYVPDNQHGGELLYLFGAKLLQATMQHIIQDYVVTFVLEGRPSTAVVLPSGYGGIPGYEKYNVDKKVQSIGTFSGTAIPHTQREEPVMEDLCETWRSFSFT